MIQIIKIPNFKSNNLISQTRLDADITVNSTVFTLLNTTGFVSGDFIILGTPGSEMAEILVVDTVPTINSFTTTTGSKLIHEKYDYVNKLFGNKIKIYRAPNLNGIQPSDITFTLLGSTDILADSQTTGYSDSSGSSAFWYKYTYFNSTTNLETDLVDSGSVRGNGIGNYCSIDAIRNKAGFKNAPYITDDIIDLSRQAAQREIDSTLQGKYIVPFVDPINAYIIDICTRLAAGLLLLDQYSATNTMNTADGAAKVKTARDDLRALATNQQVLTDTIGTPTIVSQASSWPNETTAIADSSDSGAPRIFRMSDIQGYTERRF